MPSQAGSYFADTVTYLCRHTEAGALGLIVNRPLELRFADLLDQLGIAAAEPPEIPVLAGGPVSEHQGMVLHTDEVRFEDTEPLGAGLALTASTEILTAIAAGAGPRRLLFALGYAGWGPGQLEAEIQQHAWLPLEASEAVLFSEPPQARLTRAQALTGADLTLLGGRIGDA